VQGSSTARPARASADVVIVGGGVIGSSVAYHLVALEPGIRVVVVERDRTYAHASTTLSVGGVRVQFSLAENVRISLYAQEVFERFEDEMAVDGERPAISYRQEGYLFLVAPAGQKRAEQALALQQGLGAMVEWWPPERIQEEFPLIAVEGLAGGTFGPRDGHLDPYSVLMAYRAKARSLGAEYVTDEVVEVRRQGRRVTGVVLASGERLTAGIVVNAAGAWAGEVARTAGVDLPVVPVKRQVFSFRPAVVSDRPWPLIIAPSGLYFRSESSGQVLVGRSFPDDPVGFGFTCDHRRFHEVLWPELAEVVPAFDTLRLSRGWAGLYAVNLLDGNAVLGEWPELAGLYLANGFSGHGLQQAPAVGWYLAERILGRPPFLDLDCFGPERVLEGRPLSESGLV